MSTPEAPKVDTATPAAAPAAAPPKPSAIGGIVKTVISAVLAAAAAYGGAHQAAAHAPAPAAAEHPPKVDAHPPGPTVALEPFLVTIHDANKKSHAMKMSLAVEFEHTAKEEELKAYAARIRDAILAYVRTVSYEEATDGAHMEKLRAELLERCHAAGAHGAERILITDFVTQ